MAKTIKELTALEYGSELLTPGILFETVVGQADEDGLYARKVDYSALESYAVEENRGNGAPVRKLVSEAEAAAKAHTDGAVVGGKDEGYFEGLDGDLSNGAATSVVDALNKAHGWAKAAEAALQFAVDTERDARVAREGTGPIPAIGAAAPGNFVAAFGDAAARFHAGEQRDEEQTASINGLRNDYRGPDGLSGFKKETNDKIGNMGALLNQSATLVDSINNVYAAANADLVLEDEGGNATLTGTGKTAAESLRIKDGGVATAKLADEAVTGGKIADGAVAAGKLADGAVATGKIEDLAVTAGKLADGAVATGKIEDLAVTAGKLADGAVATGKLADGAVATGKIADEAVTEGKIADGAITAGKLAVAAVDSETGELADGAVAESKIADGAVTAGKLADDVVTIGKLAGELADGEYKIVVTGGVVTLEPLA